MIEILFFLEERYVNLKHITIYYLFIFIYHLFSDLLITFILLHNEIVNFEK